MINIHINIKLSPWLDQTILNAGHSFSNRCLASHEWVPTPHCWAKQFVSWDAMSIRSIRCSSVPVLTIVGNQGTYPCAKHGGKPGLPIIVACVEGLGLFPVAKAKLSRRGYAGVGPCVHLPGFHFGAGSLSHSGLTEFGGAAPS